jgi:predicted PurR-regulated permease PerM
MTPESSPSLLRSPAVFWLIVVVLLFLFIAQVSSVLLPFVLGMLLAYLCDPFADRLEKVGCSRAIATAIITVVLFTILIGGAVWLFPLLVKQLAGLVMLLPSAFEHLWALLHEAVTPVKRFLPQIAEATGRGHLYEALQEVSQEVIGSGGDIIKRIIASSAALLNLLSLLFITPIVSFYCLRDWDQMVAHIDALLPRDYANTLRTQAKAIDDTLSGFLRGQFNVMVILAVYYCTAFTIAGVPFGFVLGLITALLIIVPYVGTLVSLALTLGVVLVDSGMGTLFYTTLGIFAVGQISEQQVLTPKIVGEQIGLHPLWMLFAMLSGAALFGFVGVLIAVPAAAVLGVLVRFGVTHYQQSAYYQGNAR